MTGISGRKGEGSLVLPIRFLLTAFVNALFNYGIYLLLCLEFQPMIAYPITYVIGIGSAFMLYGRFVFRSDRNMGIRTLISYSLLHIILLGVGSLTAATSDRILHLPRWLSGAGAIMVVVPLSFIFNRWFFANRNDRLQKP